MIQAAFFFFSFPSRNPDRVAHEWLTSEIHSILWPKDVEPYNNWKWMGMYYLTLSKPKEESQFRVKFILSKECVLKSLFWAYHSVMPWHPITPWHSTISTLTRTCWRNIPKKKKRFFGWFPKSSKYNHNVLRVIISIDFTLILNGHTMTVKHFNFTCLIAIFL